MTRMLQTVTFVSLGLLLALAGPAAAQEQLADVENRGDTLVFHPVVEFAQLVLTVTGPCDFQYRQVSSQGELFFRLDPTTIDGAYTYDLIRIEPIDPAIVEMLKEARLNADEETPKQLCRDRKLPPPPTSQSEAFQVLRGRIIYDPASVEESAPRTILTPLGVGLSASPGAARDGLDNIAAADFVIIDDLIVDGSACIGFDCVNGESFGFDTLRLKENNLRIKFDDTSTAASFPRNDWQLTANDSANGGASKFSIDDISGSRTPFTIEANARSHSLYVDDGGRIGSRTSTPSTEIHTIDGDTPTLRLQQDGSSGFAPQTWDVAGNETNFFIRDVTNGSTLPLRIRPGAPTSAIDIAASGNVGINESSPQDRLHISGNTSSALGFRMDNSAQEWAVRVATNNNLNFSDITNGGDQIRIQPGAPNLSLIIANNGAGAVRVGINDTTPSGTLDVNGTIFLSGAQIHPDFVFEPGYELETIEEHAESMWKNKHLPAMGPGEYDENGQARFELGKHQVGLLEELEKAHIYIEQLHGTIQSLETETVETKALLATVLERLEQLEAPRPE